MPESKEHPVWEVYDLHRTCRLNSKYWARKLVDLRRLNFVAEYLVMATASGSAVSGIVFWTTTVGKTLWTILAAITAMVSIAKPLLKLSDRIENLQKVVTGYHSIEFQL